MSLSLIDVRRIASDVAREQTPPLEVLAATPAEGGDYTEVILIVRGCQVEPCRMVMGFNRDVSEPEFRGAVRENLQRHLVEHAPDGPH